MHVGKGSFINPDQIAQELGATEGMRIADFGSGSGHFVILLAKIIGPSGQATAVDILESALDSVKNKARNAGLNNIRTLRANLEIVGSSGLDDGSQDMVLLINTLFQSPKKIDMIKEAHRVLNEGGKLVVIDWKKGAGGLGPPDDLRTDTNSMQSLVSGAGFAFEKNIEAGVSHYGFIFKKTH